MDWRIAFRVLIISLLLIIPLAIWWAPFVTAAVFNFIFFLAPLWLPLVLAAILVPLWLTYVRSQYLSGIPYTVLELKPGEHTPRTARAMELVFYSLYHRTDIPRIEEVLAGRIRLPWSFEVAATNGRVRLFMRVPTAHRTAIESRIRQEYPDIDFDEVRDYAREISFDPISMRFIMREFTLTKPDPYPIQNFEHYEGLKKPRDLFVELLENTVGENEHLFISLILRPHQRERARFFEEPSDHLHSDASKEITRIIGASGDIRNLPEGKKRVVAAIEQALTKPSFDCGIRAVYFGKRAVFSEERAANLERLYERFNDDSLNGFTAIDPKMRLAWPLSDIFAAVPLLADVYLWGIYRRRSFFAPPYYGVPFVLNTAELATVYHLPHIERTSPLARAGRLEAPENLPHVPLTA